MTFREPSLERLVRLGRRWIRLQEVAEDHLLAVTVASPRCDRQVVRSVGLRPLREEDAVRNIAVRSPFVLEALERRLQTDDSLEVRDEDQQIQNRLRGESGDGRRTDVLVSEDAAVVPVALERRLEALEFGCSRVEPLRVV